MALDIGWPIGLITLLLVKHFVCDFLYQPPYMWKNKGTFGHPGGIAHSGSHFFVTYLILLFFTDPTKAVGLASLEFIAHYLIDWAKMNINRVKGWASNTHNEFWILTGFDQLLHQLTYVAIVWAIYA